MPKKIVTADHTCTSADRIFLRSNIIHPPVHMSRTPSPLWTSTCGQHKMHIALSKWLVQWPSGPKAEIRLYDCNIFKAVLLVIYITNLYCQKISTFYSIQRRNSGKKDVNFFAWEEHRMMSVDSNFNFLCGRPHGAWPPRLSTCVHLSLTPLPPPCGHHIWMAPYIQHYIISTAGSAWSKSLSIIRPVVLNLFKRAKTQEKSMTTHRTPHFF